MLLLIHNRGLTRGPLFKHPFQRRAHSKIVTGTHQNLYEPACNCCIWQLQWHSNCDYSTQPIVAMTQCSSANRCFERSVVVVASVLESVQCLPACPQYIFLWAPFSSSSLARATSPALWRGGRSTATGERDGELSRVEVGRIGAFRATVIMVPP